MSKQLYYGHQPCYFVAAADCLTPVAGRPPSNVRDTKNASCAGDVQCSAVHKEVP